MPLQPSLSILIADDDAMVREVTVWMLTDAGHRVREAADGAAALDILAAGEPIDLVIADINMPRMTGIALAQQAGARWPSLPVLLVSGRPQPPGTQAYITKPFRWETLAQAIARLTPTDAAPRLADR